MGHSEVSFILLGLLDIDARFIRLEDRGLDRFVCLVDCVKDGMSARGVDDAGGQTYTDDVEDPQ
jgi:hypothetical protein